MCQYLFPLCDTNYGLSYTLSQELCINIAEKCRLEWHLVKLLHLAPPVLPDCKQLPHSSKLPINLSIDYNRNKPVLNIYSGGNSTPILPVKRQQNNIKCPPQFFNDNGTCLPECPNWSQDGAAVTKIGNIVTAVTLSLTIIAGSIHLFVSIFSCSTTYVNITHMLGLQTLCNMD